MIEVEVEELAGKLREYLERVGQGEKVVVTDGGRPLAVFSPASEGATAETRSEAGLAGWKVGRRTVPAPPKSAAERLFRR